MNTMVIEWLKVEVTPEQREFFIQTDEAIWTATLARYSGFLGKEVWINPEADNEVVLVIHWADREAWKAVPSEVLEATEQQFAQAVGSAHYRLVETGEYHVRKFGGSNGHSSR